MTFFDSFSLQAIINTKSKRNSIISLKQNFIQINVYNLLNYN